MQQQVLCREGSIITTPPITITITHPCNRFSITIISPYNRHDYDYDYVASPKLKNDFVGPTKHRKGLKHRIGRQRTSS